MVHATQIKLSWCVSLHCRPLPEPHRLVHLPPLPTTQRTPRSIALLHAPLDREVYGAPVAEHLLRAVRQLRAAHRTRLLHARFPQLLHARLVEAVRAVEDLRRAELGIVEVLEADGALLSFATIFCCRRRLPSLGGLRRLCFGCFRLRQAPIRQRHAPLLVP